MLFSEATNRCKGSENSEERVVLEKSQSKVVTEAERPGTPIHIQEPKHTYALPQGIQAQCQAPSTHGAVS